MWPFKKRIIEPPPADNCQTSITSSALDLMIGYEHDFAELIWEAAEKMAKHKQSCHITDDDVRNVGEKLISDIKETVEQLDAF